MAPSQGPGFLLAAAWASWQILQRSAVWGAGRHLLLAWVCCHGSPWDAAPWSVAARWCCWAGGAGVPQTHPQVFTAGSSTYHPPQLCPHRVARPWLRPCSL